tara:strand:+ start:10523 stop:11566 length:1044 start_codon:yes stop_codon:yes gene_type:complete
MSTEEVFFEKKGSLGLITLNRPEALNALTLNMVRLIHPTLKKWEEDNEIKTVAVTAVGDKAFCAGGDIRALYDWGKSNDKKAKGFYYEEYQLNQLIKSYTKPYISFVNGIVMGGGVGISVHGSYRVAGENYSFAMPETGIGLFPDVGGSFFLSRLKNNIGMYLALTGSRIKSSDAIELGIAEYFIMSKNYDDILKQLSDGATPNEVLSTFNSDKINSDLKNNSGKINELFSGNNLENIFEKLENDNSDFSQKNLSLLKSKSPTSLKITFRQIKNGSELDFEDCMRMEYRMVSKVMDDHDFYEGVRALIIEKDNNPIWKPETVEKISDKEIDEFFIHTEDNELNFNTR